jgi:light-regulated signal transduction histidine kinase (bacteriophytochrome)
MRQRRPDPQADRGGDRHRTGHRLGLLPRLFTPFDQLSASVVRQHGGSGLGLAISREFARLMGGDLTADSVLGEGATFTFSFVVEQALAPSGGRGRPLDRRRAGAGGR